MKSRSFLPLLAFVSLALPAPTPMECLSRTYDNHVFIVLEDAIPLPATRLRAMSGEECVGEVDLPPSGNEALVAWGGDQFTEGPLPGDPIGLEARIDSFWLRLSYSEPYQEKGISVIEHAEPARSALAASASFINPQIETRSSAWKAQIRLSASGGVLQGALFKLRPEGAKVTRIFGMSVRSSYVSDTLAAVFLENDALAGSVIEVEGTGAGTLALFAAQGVDSSKALASISLPSGATLNVAQFLFGDATGDGAVGQADVVAVFNYVVGFGSLARSDRADVYPYPQGDGRVDIRDLLLVSRFARTGAWK